MNLPRIKPESLANSLRELREKYCAAHYRHKSTGGVYVVVDIVYGSQDLLVYIIYENNDVNGLRFTRPLLEFADGRFEKIEPLPVTKKAPPRESDATEQTQKERMLAMLENADDEMISTFPENSPLASAFFNVTSVLRSIVLGEDK